MAIQAVAGTKMLPSDVVMVFHKTCEHIITSITNKFQDDRAKVLLGEDTSEMVLALVPCLHLTIVPAIVYLAVQLISLESQVQSQARFGQSQLLY